MFIDDVDQRLWGPQYDLDEQSFLWLFGQSK